MAREKKSYLDLFLDNAENNNKRKRERYFEDEQEQAILKYNSDTLSEKERSEIFDKVIGPAFKKTVGGVLEMPKFRHLPRSMNREQLVDETYFRLIEKIGKFTPEMIGKNGQPVKAFSYFSTIAKNYILEKKVRHEKILKNRADVESSIDLSILSEDTLKMMSNYDRMDVQLDDYETTFNNTRQRIIATIAEVIKNEESKAKKDDDLIKIGYCLKYLLEKWNKIEFMKKNEFMRILTLYTGLKQQQVSFLFKKFKTAVFKKIKPHGVNKVNKKVKEEDEDFDIPVSTSDDDFLEVFAKDDEMDFTEETEDHEEQEEIKAFEPKYEITSFEEFEILMETERNDKYKKTIKGDGNRRR